MIAVQFRGQKYVRTIVYALVLATVGKILRKLLRHNRSRPIHLRFSSNHHASAKANVAYLLARGPTILRYMAKTSYVVDKQLATVTRQQQQLV
jgi:hypothetical protein